MAYGSNNKYFMTLCSIVSGKEYSKLLSYLDSVPFRWSIPMDVNRAKDGIALRKQIAGYDFMPEKPCSVLEMMVALAVKCERHIMDDPEIGDRTKKWFWEMVSNLGLDEMTDSEYDPEYVEQVIERFLDREYHMDGRGGLFVIPDCDRDLRDIEIWYQMCWYLDRILFGR